MSTSLEVDNETMAGINSRYSDWVCINSRFAEVAENDILQMQDNAIPITMQRKLQN